MQDAAYACMCEFIFFYVLLLKEIIDIGWVFAQHFCNCLGPSYLALQNIIDETSRLIPKFYFAEGMADMMDWAASTSYFRSCSVQEPIFVVHARERGAETWWKSFMTGKSAKALSGIPHDTYGMTSLSIRQYVLGIYKQHT